MKYPWSPKKDLKLTKEQNYKLLYRGERINNSSDLERIISELVEKKYEEKHAEEQLKLIFKVFDYLLTPKVITGQSMIHKFVDENKDCKRIYNDFKEFTKETMHEKIVDAISGEPFLDDIVNRINRKKIF